MYNTEKFKEKMRLAVSATAAIWIAEFVFSADGFKARSSWGNVTRDGIDALLKEQKYLRLLLDSLQKGKIRTRKVKPPMGELNCGRVTLFPVPDGQRMLVVGTESSRLDQLDQALFRAISGKMTEIGENVGGKLNFIQDDPKREILMDIAKQIGGLELADLDFESILRQSVERSREIVGGTGAELGLVDLGEGVVRVVWSNVPGEKDGPYLVPIGEGVVGQVARTGMPLWINDYQSWPARKEKNSPYHSVVSVPLRFKGDVIGTLTVVDSKPDRQFSDDDVYLLEVLAVQIAISIRNVRLFQKLGEIIMAQRASEGKLIEAARLGAIGEMAASIAHELNNPLTSISGFSELLMDEFPEGSGERENMALVLREARRARDVVRRLLDFSRREKDVMSSVNVNEEISQVLLLIQPMGVTHNVTIQFDTWEDLPAVRGDRNKLRQVLLNLVANGIQSMPKGGNLLVQTALSDDPKGLIVIRVIDEGVGIPRDYLPQIFDPFFTTKPVGHGTGLGLSISKNIILEHGGDILVDSQENAGTCFTVLLPIPNDN